MRMINYLYCPMVNNQYDEDNFIEDTNQVMNRVMQGEHFAVLDPLSLEYLGELYI